MRHFRPTPLYWVFIQPNTAVSQQLLWIATTNKQCRKIWDRYKNVHESCKAPRAKTHQIKATTWCNNHHMPEHTHLARRPCCSNLIGVIPTQIDVLFIIRYVQIGTADSLLLLCQKAFLPKVLTLTTQVKSFLPAWEILLCNALLTVGNDCPKCKAGMTDEASGAICRHETPRYPPIFS